MRIGVTNQKGGAGKTTTTLNVAGALNQLGNDVLVIDLDPQGHATEGLGFEDLYDDPERDSLFDVLPELERMDELEQLVVEHQEVDCVPSHETMINAEDALANVMKREERLEMLLDDADGRWDYVLVDCPPNLGVLTDNAIVATGNVLIPAQAKSTSIRAIELLFKQLRSIESAFGPVDELALVANEVEVDGEADEMMAWFRDVFEDKEDCAVFEVRKRVALQRAWNNGVSIFEHEEECDMESVYLDVARHLEGFHG
ncbi:ParA-like partition protein [Natrialba phage PhiCh1]|uniref:Cobyrinic acid ac-diamide synthase n=2 Tax=root TaxID=1 RepID=D3T2J4_NATMM|nr:ParA family protein [Natrialba magadii]NP_665964.1 ParA-like partition protein [Natrialba phage PhiCh1]YP_010078075.1 ParA-like partition protein [Natrialba phage PhiCh1]AAM88720.1 putative plasmid partitioning protein Soj [Natrialba phage PhiCh1]ADD07803.1 ParA domain protein [Natrialba magadii ATCC 43099]ELY22956.1 Cobyrinic acid ac-diamide synthase [Natrialba magadii ATCC 43099]QBJ01226.1 ParA domain protein [Natrialba phage PhiCh1]